MARTPLAPENSAIVLIDHEVGFSNLIRSHTLEETIDGAVALAQIAKAFDMPLVVTAGYDDSPAGPLYPEVAEALGDTPVHHRTEGFDAFYDKGFSAAIEATGRKRLIMAGIQTDVCLAQTALTALDRGYEVYGVMDASAATTRETHDLAVLRLIQAGVIPTNWLAIGSELQRSWTEEKTAPGFAKVIYEHLRSWRHQNALTTNVREFADKAE
ncbi:MULTISPECIES: isochorismatase family protein [Nonomuraea]|uniref:isochorismatase family protein n=1 Tax=unclassified Nonomuraea TaxID=2593643 RepID=UPI00273BAE72|nr:isochorismatase family protein [Nonomuraea sp. G32]MDP4510286.1 isochorismatase family protein [Nonomuraea sp. G32]